MSNNKNKKEELKNQATVLETSNEGKDKTETKDSGSKTVGSEAKQLSDKTKDGSEKIGDDSADGSTINKTSSDSEDKADTSIMEEAQKLLIKHNKKTIWRCPYKGYWFFDTERVKDYEKSTGVSLEKYELKLKSDEDGE